MPFTPAEKSRIRYALGYPQVQAMASLQFGIPKPLEVAFLLETAMDNIIEEACNKARDILDAMDEIECNLLEAQRSLVAKKLKDLELRDNSPQAIEKEYVRWGFRLADILGVTVYAFSARYADHIAASGVNVSVVRRG